MAANPEGADAIAFLDGLKLADKQTSDFHWAMGRAAVAAKDVRRASRAVVVYDRLFTAVPPRDVGPIKKWLSEKGIAFHSSALKELQAGRKKEAVKDYLIAVRCDQAVLGLDDGNLRTVALKVLDKLVATHPEDVTHLLDQAFYNFFFGQEDLARKALLSAIAKEKDPYMKWLGNRVLQRMKQIKHSQDVATAKDRAVEAQQKEKEDREYQAQDAARQQQEEKSRQAAESYTAQRRAKIQEDMAAIDRQIENLTGSKSGQMGVTSEGTPVVLANNIRKVNAEIDRLRESKDQLQGELDSLR
jgi:hypothetical protein